MSQSSSSSSSSSGANEFEASLSMRADADAVYAFVSDVSNMPKFLPTAQKAEKTGAQRVRVEGESDGDSYESEGYFQSNSNTGRIEWGADEDTYQGWMQVEPEGDDASKVTIHLNFAGDDADEIPSDHINEGLQKALESIKNEVENKR